MFTLSVQDRLQEAIGGAVRALTAGLHERELNRAVGRAAQQKTVAHLYALARRKHRPHVAHNFYADAAQSVTQTDRRDAVELRIDKAGIAQRFYGGRIEAVNYSHLWIPVARESEGKSAGEFTGLVPIISPLTRKGVALKGGKVLFALVESVEQDPDPEVLPSVEDYAGVSEEAVNALLDRVLSRNVETRPFARGGR